MSDSWLPPTPHDDEPLKAEVRAEAKRRLDNSKLLAFASKVFAASVLFLLAAAVTSLGVWLIRLAW